MSRSKVTSPHTNSRRHAHEQKSGFSSAMFSTRVGATGSPVPGSVLSQMEASNGTSPRSRVDAVAKI
jgi:hypothetical protein